MCSSKSWKSADKIVWKYLDKITCVHWYSHTRFLVRRRARLAEESKYWFSGFKSFCYKVVCENRLADRGPDKQEDKGATEDELVGWHHWLNRHDFEQALGDSEGQESLACCSSWDRKESDTTLWANNTATTDNPKQKKKYMSPYDIIILPPTNFPFPLL